MILNLDEEGTLTRETERVLSQSGGSISQPLKSACGSFLGEDTEPKIAFVGFSIEICDCVCMCY